MIHMMFPQFPFGETSGGDWEFRFEAIWGSTRYRNPFVSDGVAPKLQTKLHSQVQTLL